MFNYLEIEYCEINKCSKLKKVNVTVYIIMYVLMGYNRLSHAVKRVQLARQFYIVWIYTHFKVG